MGWLPCGGDDSSVSGTLLSVYQSPGPYFTNVTITSQPDIYAEHPTDLELVVHTQVPLTRMPLGEI